MTGSRPVEGAVRTQATGRTAGLRAERPPRPGAGQAAATPSQGRPLPAKAASLSCQDGVHPEPRRLFVFIGAKPGTGWLAGQLAQDRHGFLLTGSDIPAARQGAVNMRIPSLPQSRRS
jgi:hypothetical protein